jgi:hypothetical protein
MTDMDEAISKAATRRLGGDDDLLDYTAAVLPTRFGRCVVGPIDWRKAASKVIAALGEPRTAANWLAMVDLVAEQIAFWSSSDDDDDSWFTPAERARRAGGESAADC